MSCANMPYYQHNSTHEPNTEPSQFNENNALLEQKPQASSAMTCGVTGKNLDFRKKKKYHPCGHLDKIKPRCHGTRQHAVVEMLEPTFEGKQKRIIYREPQCHKKQWFLTTRSKSDTRFILFLVPHATTCRGVKHPQHSILASHHHIP